MDSVNGVAGTRIRGRSTAVAVAALTMSVTAGCAIPVGRAEDPSASGGGRAATTDDPRFDALSDDGQQLIKSAVDDGPRHTEIGIGIVMDAGGMSIDTNPEEPMLVSDVDADGDTHNVFDMNSTMEQFVSVVGVDAPEVRIEQWVDGDWMYFDTTGFDSSMAEVDDRGSEFGDLMAPGVFKVDLNRVEQETDMGAAAITGESTGQDMDITPYLYSLADNVGGAVPDPNDPSKLRVETTLGELMQYAEDDSGALFDDFNTTPGVDGEQMADAFNEIPVVFVYSTDDQDRLEDLVVDIDMSPMFSSFSDGLTPSGTLPGSDGDDSLDALFEELAANLTMKFSISIAIDYEGVPDVTMPSGVDDDRTDAFIAALT